MDNLLKQQQAIFDQLFTTEKIDQSLKAIGAGNNAKIERFITEFASGYDIPQIAIMADLFDFTAEQKERAFKASENAQ